MRWHELRSPAIGALPRDTVVVLPTAAVEQHGPHLPTGTDDLIGEAVAERADALAGGRLLLLPAQRIGVSEHHMGFPGTLTLSHATFAAAVLETLDAVVRQGFRRVLLLNAHGGNVAIDGVVAEQAGCRWPDVEVVTTSWWRVAAPRIAGLVEGAFPAVGHACEFETSLMLALRPELVDLAAAVDDGIPPAAAPLRGDLFGGGVASLCTPFHRVTRHGVYGKPSHASAAKGRRLLEEMAASVHELIGACWPEGTKIQRGGAEDAEARGDDQEEDGRRRQPPPPRASASSASPR